MTRSAIVIVGSGQAGFQTAASLRQGGFDGDITLVGEESGLPYQRPPLSKAFLKRPTDPADIVLRKPAFFEQHDITLIDGARVETIDRVARVVTLGSERTLGYDHLVLAQGARNRRLAIPGAGLAGVFELRSFDDAVRLHQGLTNGGRLAIIGAGFIGLEVAATAIALGLDVVVCETVSRVMARAVSVPISSYFEQRHRASGVALRLETGVTRILGSPGKVTGLEVAGGDRIDVDMVLVAAGVSPNTELAEASGLDIDNGIKVDRTLLTSDANISALGDCASFESPFAPQRIRLESVQNAVDQGKCIAGRLTDHTAEYNSVPWFWSDQGDVKLQIVGIADGHDRTILSADPADDAFSVYCYRGDRLICIESVNRPGDHMTGRKIFASGLLPPPDAVAAPDFDLKAFHASAKSQAIGTTP